LKQEARNGSGFFVDRNTVVTALHVADGAKKEIADYPEGYAQIYVERQHADGILEFSVIARVVSSDEKNDLAVLSIEGMSLHAFFENGSLLTLSVATGSPDVGEEVAMSGYRGDESMPFTSFGFIALVSNRFEPTRGLPVDVVYSNLTTLPGNSGAAIISMRTGKVIGVQLGTLNWGSTPSGMSYAAGGAAITSLTESYRNSNERAN
jgi:S1-C subfamily serine protease